MKGKLMELWNILQACKNSYLLYITKKKLQQSESHELIKL